MNEILKLALEVESLALLLDRRGDEAPAEALELLRDKTRRLSAIVEARVDAEPRLGVDGSEDVGPRLGVASRGDGSSVSAASCETEEPSPAQPSPAQPSPAQPSPASSATVDLPVVDDQPDHSDEDEPREMFGAAEYTEPPKVGHADAPASAPVGYADAPASAPVGHAGAPTPAPEETIRVDEKLQRAMARELRRAFSLNDRFRFRRELFRGNDALMDDALRRIEGMTSYAEAERYFLQDLGWDADDATAADFLSIVRNHMS